MEKFPAVIDLFFGRLLQFSKRKKINMMCYVLDYTTTELSPTVQAPVKHAIYGIGNKQQGHRRENHVNHMK